KGTGSIPGVPNAPTDESKEELSWNSTDDEGADNEGKDVMMMKRMRVMMEVEMDDDKNDEEEGHVEKEEEDELYRDVNINQGRGIKANLEVKDSHVTLTSVNPDGQQQSSSVSLQFVTNMLNLTLDVDRLRDEARRENDEFLKTVDENIQKIIKQQVKEQVKVQVSKILARIKQAVNEQLEAEVLTRSSHSSKTSYETVTPKRRRDDDADKDEEPSDGPDQGSKRRREEKEPESASAPTETATRSAGRSTQGSQSRHASAAFVEEPMQTTCQMEEPSHPEFDIGTEDQPIVQSSQRPEWFSQQQKPPTPDRDWNKTGVSDWGRKRQQFYGFAVNWESARDVYSKRRIIVVTELKIVEWHSYKHLDWITVRRDDDKLYKFKEGDFIRLHIQDIKDILLLLVQGRLTNLTVEERFAFNVSLQMFTRSIIIQRRVEDLQLGQWDAHRCSHCVGNKMLKAFPLLVMSSHCQKTFPLLVKKSSPAEVIEFGDSYEAPQVVADIGSASDGSAKKKGRIVAVTTKDMQKRRNDVKVRTTLLLALSDEHQLRFSKYKTAQELWDAIMKTFGRNEATKKTKKNQLKRQYGNFKAEGKETLKKTFNRLQAIVSHLEFMDVKIEQDDLNQKFLTSLALEWFMYTIVWSNRSDLDTMSLDDLYNYIKVGNGEVNTASNPIASTQVSLASANVAAASISLDIAYRNQVEYGSSEHEGDKFWKKTGKKISIQGTDVAGFDKSKVECFNYHKIGHFARECRASRSQDRGRRENFKQGAKEAPTEFALMAKSSSDTEIRGVELKVESKDNRIERLTHELEDLKKEKEGLYSTYRPSPSVESNSSDFSISENEESSKSILSKPMIKFVKASDSPTVIKTNKVETARKLSVKYAEMYRDTHKSPKGNSQSVIDDKGYWDSGCSRHMTGNISYLSYYEPHDGGYVSFGQGGCKITGKGTIKIDKLEFENVYFMKDLKYNLLNFKLKDDTNVLLRTPRQHNMYSIDLNNVIPHKDLTCLVTKAFADECELWHRRLGKQHKASCKTKLVHSVTKPLHTLHMDLFGPTSDETSGILRNFITEIENLKDLKVKIIRCDNRGEFRNKEMNDFYSRKGIKREFSNARTPQQDRVAERRNRTLIKAARTMLGTKDAASQDVKKDVSSLRYIALPNWFHEAHLETTTSNAQDACKADAPESSENSNPTATSTNPSADQMETLTVETPIPTEEPKKIFDALKDLSWVEALQERTSSIQNPECLEFVYQMDVKSAFLYGTIDEEVYLCREFEALVHEKFQMSAMGELNFFLGLQVLQKKDGIFLSQDKYVSDILKKFGYSDVRSANTPMDKENPWGKDISGKDVDFHLYRSMIGSLMYLTASRPDIMFAVYACARHQVTPKECHLHAVKRIFRYLKGYLKLGTIVATLTTEAEYVAAASGCG
nr:hypothetical protein [Tanacetum cinerariifolium]